MDFKDFTAGKDDSDRRLDRVIRIFLKEKSLGEIYSLIRKGLIRLNQKKTKPETHIFEGDVISIASFLLDNTVETENKNAEKGNTKSASSNLNIVFQNKYLLVINKEYDRTVHGDKDGIYKDVLEYYNQNQAKRSSSLAFKPGPLHRLDRKTTGLLVFSMNLEGAKWFSEAIKNHTVIKQYYGLACGHLKSTEEWTDKITEQENDENGFYTVKASGMENYEGSTAITIAKPVAWGKHNGLEVTLVEYTIKTGRKHQIRSQSSLHGHPLLGDTAYGAEKLSGTKHDFFLHAYKLSFPENPIKMPSEIIAPLDSAFIKELEYCGIENSGL